MMYRKPYYSYSERAIRFFWLLLSAVAVWILILFFAFVLLNVVS